MTKVILPLSIVLLFFLSISGCIEDIEESNSVKPIENQVFIEGKGFYTSIQNAVDNASVGDIVSVYSGKYYETIVINKSITLIGAGNGKTIIKYNKTIVNYNNKKYNEYGEGKSGIAIVCINASNCTVAGFKIIGKNDSSVLNGIAILSSNNIILSNTIVNSTYGIYLDRESKNNTVSYNIISNNKIGIYLSYASKNNISSNNVTSNSLYGIYVHSGSNYNVFSRNVVSYSNNGVRIKGSKYNEVFRNKIENNVVKGLYVCCGSRYNYIFNNSLIQNGNHSEDRYNNQWDNHGFGNYWDDYTEKYPDAKEIDGIWDIPYNITGGTAQDRYPLVYPVDF